MLTESSPAAVFVFRERVIYANPAAVELSGYGEPELCQLLFEQLVLDQNDAQADATRSDAASQKTIRLRRKDGEIRWLRCTWTSVEVDWQPATMLSAIDITEEVRIRQQLRRTGEEQEALLRAARWMTWEWRPGPDLLTVSDSAHEVLHLEARTSIARRQDLLDLIHPEDRDSFRRSLERLAKTGAEVHQEVRLLSPSGEVSWLALSAVALPDQGHRIDRVVGVGHDISEHKLTENALFQEKDRAFVTLSSIADGVIRTDARGAIDYLNPVAQRLTGWTLAEAYGHLADEIYEIVDEESGKRILDPVQHCLDQKREVVFLGRRSLVRRDGGRIPIHDSAAPIRDRKGRLIGVILVFRDLSQVRRVEEEIRHLASHDPLTGLINRNEFEARLRSTCDRETGHLERHALCHLDLDAFKVVNDSCGHAAGDQLLRQIAAMLQQKLHKGDLLARLGSDEFALLLADRETAEAKNRAQDICDAIHHLRFHWSGRTFTPRVSLGLVPLTAVDSNAEALMGAAGAACFMAKEEGGGRIRVFQSGDTSIAERYGQMQWISRIQRAFDEQRFCLWQQTIHPLRSSVPESPLSELFIRLIDEQGAIVAPGAFIPAAERYGLIDAIDRWVVRTALETLASKPANGNPSDGRFAVNISGLSLGTDGFLDYIVEQFERTKVPPGRIFFEITETSAIANLSTAMQFIAVLKERGCLFVLDDFGQGLSSFSYLKSLPLDYLKIDGEFVREMTKDPIQAALVSSIRDIAGVMGLRTIAESVEDEATYEALAHIGVDYVQGYYLHRPRPLTTASTPPARVSRARTA